MNTDLAEQTTQRDALYQELRRRIITGELRPGQAMRDAELMAALGVGRTPLREAMMLLASEGLVTTYHRQGTFVSTVTVEGLQNALEMRMNLELFAIRLCIRRAQDAELANLAELVERKRPLADAKSVLAFDEEVHATIVGLARNQYLSDAWARTYAVCSRIKHLSLSPVQSGEVVRQELAALVSAICERDVARASAAMVTHLRSFQLTIDAGGGDILGSDVAGHG
jgi:DNA-binding GntR family transcriptional regulator